MTWTTSADCKTCGTFFELTVMDLGFKESDSLQCSCCGATLLEWRKEPRSYTISRVLRPGSIPVQDADPSPFIGKRIRIEKGSNVYEGVVRGFGQSVVATGPTSVGRPWLLETDSADVEFVPSDRWRICLAWA